ncbi:MAG TPA: phosphoglucosamine mutase, partial [Gaiellaceae bacterium]|nr:phosphoglucosamine mutase [Gaiellaceae bacterium]
MARRYFGTDGVRGVVGEFLTPELVERLGRAASLWTGASKVFVGRDTRASGVDLQEAFARGVVSAGGDCFIGGVLPTPAVALAALDLGVVISASHNPPEYNGVKFFDAHGHKLGDSSEEQIEELLAAAPGIDLGRIEHVEIATDSYLHHILERFGTDLTGMRIVVDCANGAYSGLAPHAFEQCGAEVHAIGDAPDGNNINVGCGATDMAQLQQVVRDGGYDLGIAFDGDGDRMLAVDENG